MQTENSHDNVVMCLQDCLIHTSCKHTDISLSWCHIKSWQAYKTVKRSQCS